MATPNILALTTSTPKILVSTQISVTGEHTVYTVPSSHATKITQGVISNISTTASATVGLNIIPSGGSADTTHKVIPDTYSLAPGNSLALEPLIGGMFMGDSDYISINCGTASVIDIVVTGLEMS